MRGLGCQGHAANDRAEAKTQVLTSVNPKPFFFLRGKDDQKDMKHLCINYQYGKRDLFPSGGQVPRVCDRYFPSVK